VEAQFYILFPFLLLFAQRYGVKYLLGLIFLFVGTRLLVYIHTGQVRDLAYLTIFGRMDQFLLGMLTGIVVASGKPADRAVALILGLLGMLSLLAFYSWFNINGGWAEIGDRYPWVWVIIPGIEACCFATLIIGYLAMPVIPLLLPVSQFWLSRPDKLFALFESRARFLRSSTQRQDISP
jgi:peptidoglycan/LPS O-acetylase OafA/YrhL